MRYALLLLTAIAGCNQSKPPADKETAATEADAAYLRDVDRFCYAEKHAGALEIETTDRTIIVADWLGRNLETTKARSFLASLQPLSAAEKARRLRAEQKVAKLAGCPTADAWDKEVSGE